MAAALLLLAPLGCEDGTTHVDPGGTRFELAFAVVTGPGGEPLSTLAPFGEAIGKTLDEAKIEVRLQQDQQLSLIDVSVAAILAKEERLDPAALAAISLKVGAPPQDVETIEGARARLALPETFRVWRAEREPAALVEDPAAAETLRRGLTLEIPISVEACRLAEGLELVPFSSGTTTLRDIELRYVQLVSRDRVLASSFGTLLVIDRGQPLDDTPYVPGAVSKRIPLPDHFGNRKVTNHALSLSPITRPDGTREVLVAATVDRSFRLVEAELSSAGLRFVGTATITEEELKGVAFDAEGAVIAAGGERTVLTRAPGERTFVRQTPPDTSALGFQSEFRLVRMSGVPSLPHLIGGEAQVYLGDAFTGTWRKEAFVSFLSTKLQVDDLALSVGPEGEDLWVTGDTAIFRKPPGGSWSQLDLDYPSRLTPCLGTDVQAVHLLPTHALIALDCTAMIAVRRRDLCVSVIPARDTAIALQPGALKQMAADSERLIAVGRDGVVHELLLPQ